MKYSDEEWLEEAKQQYGPLGKKTTVAKYLTGGRDIWAVPPKDDEDIL